MRIGRDFSAPHYSVYLDMDDSNLIRAPTNSNRRLFKLKFEPSIIEMDSRINHTMCVMQEMHYNTPIT